MTGWEQLPPVLVDLGLLPSEWQIIYDREHKRYAVLGIAWRDGLEYVDVLIHIDYAVTPDGQDLRYGLASVLTRTLDVAAVTARQEQARLPKDGEENR